MISTARAAFAENKAFYWLVWFGFVLFALNALGFIVVTAAPHVKADVWRHLQNIVIPFLEGREDFSILWSNPHPAPLMHILQILNLKYFGFRSDLDGYLGYFFQVLYTGMLVNCMLRTCTEHRQRAGFAAAMVVLLVISIAFGFNAQEQYTWPLLTSVQYLYFFGVALILLVDRCLRQESVLLHASVALLVLVFCFANTDFATIFLATVFGLLLCLFLIERDSVYLRTAAPVVVTFLAYRAITWALEADSPFRHDNSPATVAVMLLKNVPRVFAQVSLVLSSGLVDILELKKQFPDRAGYIVVTALALGVLYLLTLVAYLRKKLHLRTITPIALMLYAGLFAGSLLVFRLDVANADLWALVRERHIPNYKLGIIGMLWAGWLIVRQGSASTRKAIGATFATAAGLLVIQQVLQINAGWSRADRLQANNHNDALGIYLASNPVENTIEVPVRIHYHVWSSWHFDEALAYLKENELNVFSSRFPPSPLLERHILSMDGYAAATDSLRIADPDGQRDPVPAVNGAIAANWQLQANVLNLQNDDNRVVYLRLELVREVTRGPGGFVSISGADGTSRIRVYKGRQNLYFRVAPGDSLRIDFLSPTRIEELEIRA